MIVTLVSKMMEPTLVLAKTILVHLASKTMEEAMFALLNQTVATQVTEMTELVLFVLL